MTKAKRKRGSAKPKSDEVEDADMAFDTLCAIEAGDITPRVSQYFMSGQVAPMGAGVGMKSDEVFRLERPTVPSGVLYASATPGCFDVGEVVPIDTTKAHIHTLLPMNRAAKLARLFRPFVDRLPPELCEVVVTTINTDSGRVVRSQRGFRSRPEHRGGGGDRWIPFPIPDTIGARTFKRFSAGRWQEYEVVDRTEQGHHGLAIAHGPSLAALIERCADLFWSVSVTSHGCSAAVRFMTGAEGVKGFFTMREANERGRRDALRHWVRQHTRRLDWDRTTDVRRHLRGKTEFDWFGLRGTVHVPVFQELDDAGAVDYLKKHPWLWDWLRHRGTLAPEIVRRIDGILSST